MSKQIKVLKIIESDNTFNKVEYNDDIVWEGKCIFCNKKLLIDLNGKPISNITIEHIKPKSYGGTEDLENLALACPNCNHEKGRRHDVKKSNCKSLDIINSLLKKRLSRLRGYYERK